MKQCTNCNKTIVMGGIKHSGALFCSEGCRDKHCPPREILREFEAAFARVFADPGLPPIPIPSSKSGKQNWEEAEFSTVAEDGKDLIVILLGLGTVAMVSILVYWLVNLVGYPFHAQTFWFVFPIGAYSSGFVAGCGFWLAMRWFNRLPTAWTFWAAGLGGASGYVLISLLTWWLLEFQGVRVRDQVGFLEFLQYAVEHQWIRFQRGRGNGIELGKWGYPRFVLNVVGYAFGVLSTVAICGDKGYCPKCKRYLKTVGKQVRSSTDPETAAVALHPAIIGLLSGHIEEALVAHATSGTLGSEGPWTTTITVEACPGCGIHHASLRATVKSGQEDQNVGWFAYQGSSNHPVRYFQDH